MCVNRSRREIPRNYDGTAITSRTISQLLGNVLASVQEKRQDHSPIIMEAWADLIGPKLSTMTLAHSFVDGVLVVKVKNSTLYSLLCQQERPRLLQLLRHKFPSVSIKNIYFRIG